MNAVLTLTACYLLGSVPTGLLVVRAAKGVDVRRHGSGNIGMTNVWRVAGAPWGVLTLLFDLGKGSLAVLGLSRGMGETPGAAALCGLAVMLGNVFSIFLRGRGGKGVGVGVGVFLALMPEATLGAIAVFALVLAVTRMVSVGSLAGAAVLGGFALAGRGTGDPAAWLAAGTALLVAWTHRENVRRILAGTENRIGTKRGD